MKVVSIANEKGGVGKTTTAVSMAAILQHIHGKRVLLIDSDVQCNSSKTYRANLSDGTATLYDIVISDVPTSIQEVIQTTPLGDIIPSDPLLSEFDSRDNRKMLRLKNELNKVSDKYDYVIIDTPPTSWDILKAVLVASDCVIIPTKASEYGIEGLQAIWNMIRAVRDGINSKLHITGILITEYERRLAILENARIINEKLCPLMNTQIFTRMIRRAIAVEESQIQRTSLYASARYSNPELDYEAVVKEFLEREGDL